jgi:hypothetical protein
MKVEKIREEWDNFRIRCAEFCKSNVQIWNDTFDELIAFIENNLKIYKEGTDQILPTRKTNRKLAEWLYHNNQHYEHNTGNIYDKERWENFMKKYSRLFRTGETKWIDTLEKIKLYIDTNNKRPSGSSADKETRKLGKYIQTTKEEYNRSVKKMQDPKNRKIWEEFITDEKYAKYFDFESADKKGEKYWFDKLECVKKYIGEHGKPSKHSDDKEERSFGEWIYECKYKYKNNIQIMSHKNIRTVWENFLKECDI